MGKSFLSPATKFVHLGLVVDLRHRRLDVPFDKLSRVWQQAADLLTFACSHRHWVAKHALAAFMGLAVSLSPALQTGRFHCIPLYDALASSPSWRLATIVRLSNLGYHRLRDFWLCLSPQQCGMSWDLREPAELLFTDASDFGYGAHLSAVTH